MILFQNLLTTDYGLLSLAVIVGVLIIGAWLSRWIRARMDEDAPRDA